MAPTTHKRSISLGWLGPAVFAALLAFPVLALVRGGGSPEPAAAETSTGTLARERIARVGQCQDSPPAVPMVEDMSCELAP